MALTRAHTSAMPHLNWSIVVTSNS